MTDVNDTPLQRLAVWRRQVEVLRKAISDLSAEANDLHEQAFRHEREAMCLPVWKSQPVSDQAAIARGAAYGCHLEIVRLNERLTRLLAAERETSAT